MVRKCPGLESISLGECSNIGDTSILEIATYKPNIKHLDANSCKKLTDNSLRSLASFCGKLQTLNIKATNVTDIGYDHKFYFLLFNSFIILIFFKFSYKTFGFSKWKICATLGRDQFKLFTNK